MVWPIFPQCPAYGFTSRPDYSATVVERASGVRSVNRNWYYPLHVYTGVPIGEKFEDDIHRVLRFWHAIGGQAGTVRFLDYVDYKSSVDLSDDVTPIDQPLVLEENSPGGYQLTKVYEDPDALLQQQRQIKKPRQGTIRIAEGGVELEEGVDYTIDYNSGLVTFLNLNSPPGTLTWGGEFYVPVMFEAVPEFMITNKAIQSTSVVLRELRLRTNGEP